MPIADQNGAFVSLFVRGIVVAKTLTRLGAICFAASMVFGALAATERPSHAQVTVTCWKEYCVYDRIAKKQICVKEEIPCP